MCATTASEAPELSAGQLADLAAALAKLGLFIVRPVSQAALAHAGVAVQLSQLLPGGRAALVIGDGGGGFFAGFSATADLWGDDPLDHYTARVIPATVRAALGPALPFAVRYPFDQDKPALPMQQIGIAAGLPAPGPLGIQIHPDFGPWWAYRALVVLPCEIAEPPALVSRCTGCPAPCQPACPGNAVRPEGLHLLGCASHRWQDPSCHHTCVARRACIVAPAQAYPPAQLGFHMAASLATVRRYFGG